MAEMGYKDNGAKGKKLNTDRTAQTLIKGAVFGDALICFNRAVKALGLVYEESTTQSRGPFGPIEVPFINHETDDGIIIPYGAYRIEGLGKINPADNREIVPELTLSITFEKGADETLWKKLIDLIHAELKTHKSIFRGRAVKIESPIDMIVPRYIDVSKDFHIFLNTESDSDIDTNLYFPITHAEKLRGVGVEGYRGVLLHGKYGTGKTLVAYQAARLSVARGRTFVLCNANSFGAAIVVARFLEPSTLFVEDLDVINFGSSGLSRLRNTLSGVESKKGFDVMVILTTNLLTEVEKLDRSLLRPDRIDAIIELTPPDVVTTRMIVEHHAKDWLEAGDGYNDIYEAAATAECTPAILCEVIKRSKIVAMKAGSGITPEIMAKQLSKMERQIQLSEPKKPVPENVPGQLADALQQVVQGNYE